MRKQLFGSEYRFEHAGHKLATLTPRNSLMTFHPPQELKLSPDIPPDNPLRLLILGAAFCIPLVV